MSKKRREAVLDVLRQRKEPVTGNELAALFGVSRQVIVQDIALLRAHGADIVATSQGYLHGESGKPSFLAKRVACRHQAHQTRAELLAMVESGCRVVDVIVEHPLYGEIRGLLLLQTPADVERFVEQYENQEAQLLSSLTGGVHLHTLQAPSATALKRAEDALRQLGFLLD
ncbi:MAG: transcription repressor NadR [Firmicutes bacterium]|nr:transcription repressor NadR [Bacillota bacterium]